MMLYTFPKLLHYPTKPGCSYRKEGCQSLSITVLSNGDDNNVVGIAKEPPPLSGVTLHLKKHTIYQNPLFQVGFWVTLNSPVQGHLSYLYYIYIYILP
jgi:hypothetical protein